MNTFIDKSKDSVIKYLLNIKRKKDGLSIEELKLLKKELDSKIKTNTMCTTVRSANGRTNSNEVNETLNELYIDLLVAFSCCDEIDKLMDQYIQANISSINTLNSNIESELDRINDFSNILKTNGNPLYISEGFRSNYSFENNRIFFTERYGEKLPRFCNVFFNEKSEYISIPLLRHANMVITRNGVSCANINMRKQLGDNLMKIKNSTVLENCIDTSLQSYWSESILANEPIRVEFSNIKPLTPSKLKDFYYGIKQGAMFELEINFEAISIINEIELMPFGKYPMELVAIRYSSTDDIDSDLEELIYPDNTMNGLNGNVKLDKTISFKFEDIKCKRMYIIVNQIHYERNNFILNTTDAIKNDIWHNIVNEKNISKYVNKDYIFKPNYIDRFVENKSFSYINEELVRNRKLDLNKIFFNNDNIFKSVLKNKYTYGFYNIAAFYNDFNQVGVYVSKPIEPNKNIKSISITTQETHQLSSDKNILTDIEYYISYSSSPTYDDWIPILPLNKKYIDCEMLQLGSDECILRFAAKKVDVVFMNDILLKENIDYIVHMDGDNIRSIEIPNYNHRAIYRASYEPTSDSCEINLIDNNYIPTTLSTTDTILGNGENIYELENCPYVDTKSSTKVRIVDVETGQVLFQDGDGIECVTDVINPSESYQNFRSTENLLFQYYTYENKIYLNHPIASNMKIEVSYKHYVSKFRLKAILRRNTFKDTWLSPIINNIEYKITTIQ